MCPAFFCVCAVDVSGPFPVQVETVSAFSLTGRCALRAGPPRDGASFGDIRLRDVAGAEPLLRPERCRLHRNRSKAYGGRLRSWQDACFTRMLVDRAPSLPGAGVVVPAGFVRLHGEAGRFGKVHAFGWRNHENSRIGRSCGHCLVSVAAC